MIPDNLPDRESLFAALPKGGIGAEIGVDWGTWSLEILKLAEPRLLYLIDCWEIQPVEVYGHDPANTQQDIKYRQCLGWFTTDERVKMVKAFSQDAATLFPDGYFDHLYIDANHLQCYADMTAWWPKVKPGGYMLGHDYVVGGVGDFITTAVDVDRFVAEHGLHLQLTTDAVYQNWILTK